MQAKKKAAWHPKDDLNPAFTGGLVTDRDWLWKKYIIEKQSIRQIAKQAECSVRKVARWLKKFEIQTRTTKAGKHLRPLSGSLHYNWKGGLAPCSYCGGEKAFGATMCRDCRNKTYKGVGNPNYKGISDIMSSLRTYVSEYWSPLVFQRDGYTCQMCWDSFGGNLQAHHIKRLSVLVSEIIKDFSTETANERERIIATLKEHPKINDLSNGVTLCKECHSWVHLGPQKDSYPINEELVKAGLADEDIR